MVSDSEGIVRVFELNFSDWFVVLMWGFEIFYMNGKFVKLNFSYLLIVLMWRFYDLGFGRKLKLCDLVRVGCIFIICVLRVLCCEYALFVKVYSEYFLAKFLGCLCVWRNMYQEFPL